MWEDVPTFKDDLQIRTLAVVSTCCKTDLDNANKAWNAMRSYAFYRELRAIEDPSICKIGMGYQPY